MKRIILFLVFAGFATIGHKGFGQVNDEKTGAWYMYFWSATFKESSFGFQGDLQYRNWNVAGDLEQLLIRTGATWSPQNSNVKFTLGYAYIGTGQYGDSRSVSNESRIYQEALLPQKILNRVYLIHRFRYEQRFVEGQDFRTRYRYNFFINIPFNKASLEKGALYLALYNELFINGQRNIGNGNRVEFFDRNRLYGALGYSLKDNLRLQFGAMQQTTNTWRKTQIQLSLHHTF